MRRVIIADDHTTVRMGLKQILQDAFPNTEIAEATDGEELLKKVITGGEWDLVVTDVAMPGRSGLEVLQQIRQNYPRLPVLILSMFPEEQYAIRAFKAGASGYLNKESAPEELVAAINRVLMGRKYITPSIAEKIASQLDTDAERLPHEYLSDREFEIFKLLAAGKPVSAISQQLSLSVTTVSTYRSRIMTKMNLKTNADLTVYAIENKLL